MNIPDAWVLNGCGANHVAKMHAEANGYPWPGFTPVFLSGPHSVTQSQALMLACGSEGPDILGLQNLLAAMAVKHDGYAEGYIARAAAIALGDLAKGSKPMNCAHVTGKKEGTQ
jgi:hypothetical protein